MFYEEEVTSTGLAMDACGGGRRHPAFDAAFDAALAILSRKESWIPNPYGRGFVLSIEACDVAAVAAVAAFEAFEACK
jgi:hypothetical protein